MYILAYKQISFKQLPSTLEILEGFNELPNKSIFTKSFFPFVSTPNTTLLKAQRTPYVLQHVHCAYFEALPANDAIRGSAELGPKGCEFMGWLWGPAGNQHHPSFMCGLV